MCQVRRGSKLLDTGEFVQLYILVCVTYLIGLTMFFPSVILHSLIRNRFLGCHATLLFLWGSVA